jgi:hypothetical protein
MKRGGTGNQAAVGTGTAHVTSEVLSEGEHEGRLVYVADLGLQQKSYKGEDLGQFYQAALGIEIIGEVVTIEDEDGNEEEKPLVLWDRPFYAYDTMTEKGVELKRYQVFEPSASEGQVPDWEAQLGKPVNVNVIHNEGKGDNAGKMYPNIKSLTPIPAKYQDGVGEANLTAGMGDSDDEDNPINKVLFGLVKYIYDKRIIGEQPHGAPKDKSVAEGTEAAGNDQPDFDDDIPF